MERNLELCSGMSGYFFSCSFSFLVLCHPAPRRWSRARRMRRPRACVRRSGGVRSPGGCLQRRRKHARERLATPFSNARRTLVHVRQTPSECLRRRPSVSLEHQHSTPVVSHCAAHSFDPGEPSHRSTFFVFFFLWYIVPALTAAQHLQSVCESVRAFLWSINTPRLSYHTARRVPLTLVSHLIVFAFLFWYTRHCARAHGRPTLSECS